MKGEDIYTPELQDLLARHRAIHAEQMMAMEAEVDALRPSGVGTADWRAICLSVFNDYAAGSIMARMLALRYPGGPPVKVPLSVFTETLELHAQHVTDYVVTVARIRVDGRD